MSYQVFIERAKNPGAEHLVAGAIGSRFGLPPDTLAARMSEGRFRVKSNVDLETAQRFAGELEKCGAVCSVVDASGAAVSGHPGTATPAPSVSLQMPVPSSAKGTMLGAPLGPAPAAQGVAPAPPAPASPAPASPAPAPPAPAGSDMESGLAAAFSGGTPQDLGALGSGDSMLSLASLDDAGSEPKPKATAPADSEPVGEAAFLPPDAVGEDLALAVDVERPAPAPQPDVGVPGFTGGDAGEIDSFPMGASEYGVVPDGASVSMEPAMARARRQLREKPRVRLLTGVLLALFLGFIPAQLLSLARWSSATAEVEQQLREAYNNTDSLEAWEELDQTILGHEKVLESRRLNIGITSCLVWALVGGGFAFVWFRKLDF